MTLTAEQIATGEITICLALSPKTVNPEAISRRVVARLREAGYNLDETRLSYEQVGWAHPAIYSEEEDAAEDEAMHHPWMFDCARVKPGESVAWRPVYVLDGYDPGGPDVGDMLGDLLDACTGTVTISETAYSASGVAHAYEVCDYYSEVVGTGSSWREAVTAAYQAMQEGEKS